MTQNDVQAAIEARTQSFVQDIAALVRQAAVDSIQQALGQGPVLRVPPSAGRRSKRIRRTAASLSETAERLFAEIRTRPGQRIEQIARSLGVSTKSLVRPAKMLIAERRITTRGHKRATQYFALS